MGTQENYRGLAGTSERLIYTVYGDEVNLAAPLEQLNKEYGTRILVSERTRELAGPDRFPFKRIGEVMVRGRKAMTVIYALPISLARFFIGEQIFILQINSSLVPKVRQE